MEDGYCLSLQRAAEVWLTPRLLWKEQLMTPRVCVCKWKSSKHHLQGWTQEAKAVRVGLSSSAVTGQPLPFRFDFSVTKGRHKDRRYLAELKLWGSFLNSFIWLSLVGFLCFEWFLPIYLYLMIFRKRRACSCEKCFFQFQLFVAVGIREGFRVRYVAWHFFITFTGDI